MSLPPSDQERQSANIGDRDKCDSDAETVTHTVDDW